MRLHELAKNPTFTPAFWAWFGKSKVVDAAGNPLKVYHGTTKDFTSFSYGHTTGADMVGSGFYFTTDPGETTIYSGGDGGNTIGAYLSIQNPLDATRVGSVNYRQIATIMRASPRLSEALEDWGDVEHEGFNKVFSNAVEAYSFSGRVIVRSLFSLANDIFGDNYVKEFNQAITKTLGYDGVFKDNGEMGTHWVAWHPYQIKAATNRGTFDPNSDHMGESR